MEHRRWDPEKSAAETATASLSTGALLFIWGIRQWLVAARDRQCIKRALMIPYYRLECVAAIYHLDALMRAVTEGAERRMQIRCPHHDALSNDELDLLLLVRAAQQKDPRAAARQAAWLVSSEQAATKLSEAASAYANQLSWVGLSLSSPPQLKLLSGAAG